jgi:membrane protein YdbS with pleckstrin-like domain
MLSKYRLPNKIEDEKIIQVVRRDLFVLFIKIVWFFFLSIIPLFFYAVVSYNNPDLFFGEISSPLIILGSSAYYLFIWLFFFFSFIDYYLDIWIITSERIIDIEQHGFFSRVIAEHKLFRIQDVTSEVHGVIPTMLKFGDVHVQTAGSKERFFFHQIPNPEEVRNTIIQLVKVSQKKHRQEMIDEETSFQDFRGSGEVKQAMKH